MSEVFELKGTIKIEGADAVKATIKDTAASVDESTGKMGDSSEQLAAEFKKNTEQINKDFDKLEKNIKETTNKSEQNFNRMKRNFNTLGNSMMLVGGSIIASLTGIAMTAMNNQEAIDKMSVEDQAAFEDMRQGWTDMKQAALDLTMTIGSSLAPVFADLFQKLTDIMKPIKDFLDEHPGLVKALGEILIPVAGLVFAVGMFMKWTIGLAAFMKAWKELTIAQTISQWLLNAAMYANPIVWIVGIIALLIAAVVLVIYHFDTIKRWFLEGWDIIKAAFGKVVDWFKAGWETVKNAFLFVWNSIHNAFASVINGIMAGIEGFVNFFIRGINFIIDALNKLSFDMPSWLGGGHFGINISPVAEVSLPRVEMKEVPTLDTGAYVQQRTGGTIARLAANVDEYVLKPTQLANIINVANQGRQGITINVEKMQVRDDNDILRIAEQLDKLTSRRLRAV